jgi:hypothetical protein
MAADHATIATLSDEKIALAKRLATIVTRPRARLNHDIGKVLVLQGELDPGQLATYSSIVGPAAAVAGGAVGVGAGVLAATVESLKAAVAPEPAFSQSVSTGINSGTSNKRMCFIFPSSGRYL